MLCQAHTQGPQTRGEYYLTLDVLLDPGYTYDLWQIKVKPWEKSLVDDSLGADVKSLLRKAEELELQYLQSLPKPGTPVHTQYIPSV